MQLLKGLSFDTRDLESRRIVIFKLMTATALFFISTIALLELLAGYMVMTLIEAFAIVVISVNYIIFLYTRKVAIASVVMLFTTSLVPISAMYIEAYCQEAALFWIASMPIYIFLLLETKHALILSYVNIALILVITVNSIVQWHLPVFGINIMWQILAGYLTVTAFVMIFEHFRTEYENTLDHMVEERDKLLQEVNHRVKNNMQIIISMLRLQSDRCSQEVKDVVTVAENRIRSMLSIHELLYKQAFIRKINTNYYITQLAHEIQKSYSNDEVEIVFDVCNEELSTEVLTQTGFILNELVTNAIKYAKNPDGVIITISMTVEDHKMIMEVRDNGATEAKLAPNGLGMIFVRTIVEDQMQGSLDIRYEKGLIIQTVLPL